MSRRIAPGHEAASPGLSDFSDVVLDLYRGARERPLDQFQDAALEVVKKIVPFNTAIWGTASVDATGVDIHTIHLHRTSRDMLDAYEHVKHEDACGAEILRHGRSTQSYHSRTNWARTECGEFLREFEHENFIVSGESNRDASFIHWFSLYRAKPEQRCQPEENKLVEALRPHLMQALALNRSLHLERTMPALIGLERGLAVANVRGMLYLTDPRFDRLMSAEWPGWAGPALPTGLMTHLLARHRTFSGRRLVLRCRVEHGLLFLQARRRRAVDALTAKELRTARLVADGHTHKEIATRLSLSSATTRSQIQSAYEKLGVHNVAGLIEELKPALWT